MIRKTLSLFGVLALLLSVFALAGGNAHAASSPVFEMHTFAVFSHMNSSVKPKQCIQSAWSNTTTEKHGKTPAKVSVTVWELICGGNIDQVYASAYAWAAPDGWFFRGNVYIDSRTGHNSNVCNSLGKCDSGSINNNAGATAHYHTVNGVFSDGTTDIYTPYNY